MNDREKEQPSGINSMNGTSGTSGISGLGGEFALIRQLTRGQGFSDLDPSAVLKGVGDDCAVLRWTDDRALLVTTDMLVQNRHFRLDWSSPEDIGQKAMEASVSDISAMGGTPLWAFVSLGLPDDFNTDDAKGIYDGFNLSCSRHNFHILGGDTTACHELVINIVMLGECPADLVCYRNGAKSGDVFCVTGNPGRSLAGLKALQAKDASKYKIGSKHYELVRAHLAPLARSQWGRLIGSLASSMIDISDGLSSEIQHICEQSGVGALIKSGQISISEDVEALAQELDEDPVDWVLKGGEDFELLFTMDETYLAQLQKEEVKFTVIGKVVDANEGIWLEDENGDRTSLPRGYDHFSG